MAADHEDPPHGDPHEGDADDDDDDNDDDDNDDDDNDDDDYDDDDGETFWDRCWDAPPANEGRDLGLDDAEVEHPDNPASIAHSAAAAASRPAATVARAATAPMQLPARASAFPLVGIVCKYLHRPERYQLATVARLAQHQALALYAIPSASMDRASARGLVDLLQFRLRNATLRVGCLDRHEALAWTLHARNVPTASTASASPLVIEWWELDGYTPAAIAGASKNGHLHVLQWWQSSGLHLKFDTPKILEFTVLPAVVWARIAGHDKVVSWWETCPDPVAQKLVERAKYPEYYEIRALPGALSSWCASGSTAELDWCKRNNVRIQGTSATEIARAAAVGGHINVLNWCKSNGVNLDSQFTALCAIKKGQAAVLQWLVDNEISTPWDTLDVCALVESEASYNRILPWWTQRFGQAPALTRSDLSNACSIPIMALLERAALESVGKRMYLSVDEMSRAARNGHVQVFEWYLKQDAPPPAAAEGLAVAEVPFEVVDAASAGGQTALLQWFKDRGVLTEYTAAGLQAACKNGDVAVLEWWLNSGLPLDPNAPDGEVDLALLCAGKRHVLEWLHRRRQSPSSSSSSSPSGAPPPPLRLEVDFGELLQTSGGGEEDVVDALQWWNESGAFIRWSERFAESPPGKVYLLEWWTKARPKLIFPWRSKRAGASEAEQRWWLERVKGVKKGA
ncbi:hypothetical protein DFJ73DRAFT_908800 [Zopfochytrium polystomum]|nr:hypothetical protein DFJ73DRAFT_908800 [Zopfochytrium polystomum]